MQQGKCHVHEQGQGFLMTLKPRLHLSCQTCVREVRSGAVGVGSTPAVLCASYKFSHLQPGEEMYALAFAGELFPFYTL